MRRSGLTSFKVRRVERGNFSNGKDAHNDEEDDDPSLVSAPVIMLDEINNSKHDVSPGRFLEGRMNYPDERK